MPCTGGRLAAFARLDHQLSVPRDVCRYPTEPGMTTNAKHISIRSLLAVTTACALYSAMQNGEPKFTVSNLAFAWLTLAVDALPFILVAVLVMRFTCRRVIVASVCTLLFLLNSGCHLIYATECTLTEDFGPGPVGAFLDRKGLDFHGPVSLGLNVWVTE